MSDKINIEGDKALVTVDIIDEIMNLSGIGTLIINRNPCTASVTVTVKYAGGTTSSTRKVEFDSNGELINPFAMCLIDLRDELKDVLKR